MKKNRKKADRLWIGLIVGLLTIVLMTVLFFHSNGWELNEFGKVMKYLGKDSMAMAKYAVLCVMPNLLLVFLSYRLELWDTYKGVMAIILFSLVPIVYFLF